MKKKLYRKKDNFFSQLISGTFLCYVSIDNILEGPLRKYLGQYFKLEEFGSNTREESLYYIILFFGIFQIIFSVQVFFQPVIEIKNGKIALKTREKILSVIMEVGEITDINEKDDNTIVFSFHEKSYEVVVKHLDNDELESILNEINPIIFD